MDKQAKDGEQWAIEHEYIIFLMMETCCQSWWNSHNMWIYIAWWVMKLTFCNDGWCNQCLWFHSAVMVNYPHLLSLTVISCCSLTPLKRCHKLKVEPGKVLNCAARPSSICRIEHYLLQVSFICQCQNLSLSTYSMCGGALVVTGVNRGLTPKKLVAILWYIDSIRPIFHPRLRRGWCWLWW